MYIVIDKKTDEIIWKNPAPLTQQLQGPQVWHEYDDKKHIVIACDNYNDKVHKISGGKISVKTLQEQVDDGHVDMPPGHKIDGDEIVPKTEDEKIQDGELSLDEIRAQKKAELKNQYQNAVLKNWLESELSKNTEYNDLLLQVDGAKSASSVRGIK